MADAASVTLSATVLPDEIAKTISGSMTVTPADTSEKWYYKQTTSTTRSTDLIAGNFTDDAAVAVGSSPVALATGDKIPFLFVKNTDTTDDVYINIAGAASASATGSIKIAAGHSWFMSSPNTTVGDVHVIASANTPVMIVAAIIDDV